MRFLKIFAIALVVYPVASFAHESEDGNILIQSVVAGSPAEAAGLEAGDELLTLDGREVKTQDDLQEVLAAHQSGNTVPVTVERNGKPVDLALTFGKRPDGGVSIGVSMAISSLPAGAEGMHSAGPKIDRDECLYWVDETYRVDSMMQDLGLDSSKTYRELRSCITKDLQRMPASFPFAWCDNVFKVHCSGLDLLTEIGEAQVDQCAAILGSSLGVNVDEYRAWRTCGQRKVFDRYSMRGEASSEDDCRAAFLSECGSELDAAVEGESLTAEQQSFARCCSADEIDPTNSDQCVMIDSSFERGPCRDRAVCVNRFTNEWIDCSLGG